MDKKENPPEKQKAVADLLVSSVTKLHPDAVLSSVTFGKGDEEGKFSCDFSMSGAFSEKEIGRITETMGELIEESQREDISPANFLLLGVSSAQSKESPSQSIQRIDGIFFDNQQEKQDYLEFLKKAKERDHVRLGRELGLFVFAEHAPGMPYWLPKGLILKRTLLEFWREEHKKRGYQEIQGPMLSKIELFKQSGHADHYRENMFVAQTDQGEWAAKPMNCPNTMWIFSLSGRSHRDLPLRISDCDTLHRLERSGVLNGLLRAQEFQQDDAHIFVAPEQIESEIKNILEIVDIFYSVFGLPYSFSLSTRGENYMGDLGSWDKAESILTTLLENQSKPFSVSRGEAAFYGPKIDIMMKDSLRREWQMGTIQLDFQLPKRFGLKYTDNDGAERTPVVIHRVVYGSLERFIGIITEHFGGAFPTWLAPVQASVLPVTGKDIEYALSIVAVLEEDNRRVDLYDDTGESLSKRISKSARGKTPYTIVVGERERRSNTVSVRPLLGEKTKPITLPLDTFRERLKEEVEEKSLERKIRS